MLILMSATLSGFGKILHERGCKVTVGRLRLLKTLSLESKPVTVAYLQQKLAAVMDKVTLYRSLQSMTVSGLVREIDFRHGHAHYELAVSRPHHHHLVCTSCETVTDMRCPLKTLPKKPIGFRRVDDHAVEFFGICNKCVS